jgi:hypothetical protein
MITEEAVFPLTQESPHHAHPSFCQGHESTVLQFSIYTAYYQIQQPCQALLADFGVDFNFPKK